MRFKKTVVLWGILVIMLLNLGVYASVDSAVLKYRMETGAQYRYRVNVNTQVTQQIGGQKVDHRDEWQIEYGITVLSGNAGKTGIMLRFVCESLFYQCSSPYQQYSNQLTTDRRELPPCLQPYAALLNKDFKLKLQNGPTLLLRNNHALTPNFDLRQLLGKNGFGTALDTFPYLIFNIFPVYPKKAKLIKNGAIWRKKQILATDQFVIEVPMEYRIAGTDAVSVRMEARNSSECSLVRKSVVKNNDQVVAEIVANLNGYANGYFRIDKNSGLPLNGELNLNLSGTLQKSGKMIPTGCWTKFSYQLITAN